MKHNLQHTLLLTLLLLLGVSPEIRADREVNQPQLGKQVIEVASDEVITFYDPWGTDNVVDNNSYNAQSLTVFKPVEAGKSVQITFETIDLNQYSASYYLYLNLYDGVADSDDAFSWPTSTSSVSGSSSLSGMNGTLLAEKINNANKPSLPAVYTSGTADGALSVGFMHRNSNECAGWVAKVKVVTLENMTITGAGSHYAGIGGPLTTKQNVALANAYVTATGVMNPDPVTAIYFTMTKNEGVVDPLALKLYKGDTPVEATVTAAAENQYYFSLNALPSDGTTTFTVRGDILSTAAIGAKTQIDINKITTVGQPDGIAPFTVGTGVEVENPAIILMSATPQTVSVGETSLLFYDEGGKDGGIVSKTNGQVTFLSGVEGKKVMVNLTKNNIWHGTLYNQELRIYNGREVKADALIRTLQKGETALVRSTADDGALTVVLYSDASNAVEAEGFEAEVSLFTPQPMDFDGITATAASTETVTAGDEAQDMLTINVKAQNTEPAMQVTKMAFSTEDTHELISKASLYFGTKLVGSAMPETSNFELTLDAPQPLNEGDNLFTLKYDLNDEAVNDQVVLAKLLSVTALVNQNEKSALAPESSVVHRTVKNEIISHAGQGTVTKKVNGAIAFVTKTTSSYSSYCEAGTDDRINVFVPKHEGMVAQIDFSEFEVQYSSSSYGTKSKFRIYAGQGTGGELLWELNSHDQEAVGPAEIIRSTAADGALTVVFNPNSSYSYYYKGFKATVSEYLPKNMEVSAVETTHPTTADASIGATDQELLAVNVKTEGDQNALSFDGLTVSLKGTETNIARVSVWQGAEKLAEAEAAAEVSLTLSEPLTLKEGDNLFSVKADISAEAAENSVIDAALTSLYVGSVEVTVENADPEGSRTLKNMLLMTDGNHGTMSLGLGKQLAIFDDGGAEGDGADGVEATVTLAPTAGAESIQLTCQNISFAYTAYLYIYEGTEVDDTKLLIDNRGASKPFSPIIVDGPVTLKYIGKGSYSKPNFAITAEGYKKSDVVVTGVTTEDISVNEVLKGQTDVKMLKIAVEAKGELAPAKITAFNAMLDGTETVLNGAAAESVHIYQTGTTATFSANEAFGGEYSITNSGTYYFWLTYDVKADAEVGQKATAAVTSVVVNGSTIDVENPATATITIASGKHGDYPVGEGGNYATIQQAIDDFGALGMDGAVTLKIKPGNYNEKVRVPYIKGMGAVNTLTIESESGERDVKIYHNNYTTGGYSDDQHKKDYGVITLYEASYVTLKNLEVYTEDKAYKAVVMVEDESRHVTIDNCYLHAPACVEYTGEDVVLVGHTIIDEENKNNDYLTVRNCLLEGGKFGISMGGTNYVALPKEVGGVVEGNTFKNNSQKALYVMDELGVKIRNNTFIIDEDAPTKMSVGILDMQLRDAYSEASEITGNIFNVAPSTYTSAMSFRQLEGTEEAPVIIANNVVNIKSKNGSYAPLKLDGTKFKNVNIAHNTLRMTGMTGSAAFWVGKKLDEGYGNIQVVNNIIQNETSGYAVNLFNDANLGTDKFNFQNNLISTLGESFFRASSDNEGNFDAFVEKTGATGNINKQAVFVSEEILEPLHSLDGDLLKALKLGYVTTDINGTVRPEENISIGAYEYDPDLTRIPVVAEGYPKATAVDWHTAMISVKSDMNGKAYILLAEVNTEDPEALVAVPTAETLKSVGHSLTLNKDAEATLKIDTLKELTSYSAFVLVENPRGNATEVLSTEAFTTPMEPVDLLIACTEPVTTVADGSETELKVMVASGRAPFKVKWLDSKHEVVCDSVVDVLGEEIIKKITPAQSGDYYVSITDAQQFEAKDTCRIIVSGKRLVADFENLYLDANSNWHGPDTKGAIEEGIYGDQQYQGSFLSGSYQFSNNYSIDWSSWSGFSYANSTETTGTNIMQDQWNAITGKGFDESAGYAVFFEDAYAPMTVRVLSNDEGDIVSGFYITNASVTVNAFLNGDGMTPGGFTTGDFFKLTVTADDDDERTVEFYLADYRSANADEHSYVSDWQWVDLSTLGKVKELSFHLESSRSNAWGYTTPLYFCMDNLGGEAPVVVPEGIRRVSADKAPSQRFDLNGRQIDKPMRGLNIIRQQDGSVRKVLVR